MQNSFQHLHVPTERFIVSMKLNNDDDLNCCEWKCNGDIFDEWWIEIVFFVMHQHYAPNPVHFRLLLRVSHIDFDSQWFIYLSEIFGFCVQVTLNPFESKKWLHTPYNVSFITFNFLCDFSRWSMSTVSGTLILNRMILSAVGFATFMTLCANAIIMAAEQQKKELKQKKKKKQTGK